MIQMNFKKSLALLLIFTVLASKPILAKESDLQVISWSNDIGIERFPTSSNVDFFKLANHFESQNNKIYCGVASSVIVLNALRVRNGEMQSQKPSAGSVLSEADREYISFSPFFDRYTQDNVFTTHHYLVKNRLQ